MKSTVSIENIPDLFPELPEHTRLWIYQASHKLSDDDSDTIQGKLNEFCSNWSSHGKPLKCAAAVLYNTFIVIGVDEISQSASGCSIDSSVAFVKELEEGFDVSFFERMIFAVNKDKDVKLYDMESFKEAYNEGSIDENTLIFNNQVKTKSEFERAWIIPLEKSWHLNFIQAD